MAGKPAFQIDSAIAAGDVPRVEFAIRQHNSIQGERFNDLPSLKKKQSGNGEGS